MTRKQKPGQTIQDATKAANGIKGKAPLLDGVLQQSARQQLRHLLALGRLKEARSVVEQDPENVRYLVSMLDDPTLRITWHSEIVLKKIVCDGACLKQIIDELRTYIRNNPRSEMKQLIEDAEDHLVSPDFEKIRRLLAKCQQRKAKAIVKQRPENLLCLVRLTARIGHENDAAERAAQVLFALAKEGWQVAEMPKVVADFISKMGVKRFSKLRADFGRILRHVQKHGVDISCVFLTIVNALAFDQDVKNRLAACSVLHMFACGKLDISPVMPALVHSAITRSVRDKNASGAEVDNALLALHAASARGCDITGFIQSINKIIHARSEPIGAVKIQAIDMLTDWYISKKDVHSIGELIEDSTIREVAVKELVAKLEYASPTYEKRKSLWFAELISTSSRTVRMSLLQRLEERIERVHPYNLENTRGHIRRIMEKLDKDAPEYQEMREALTRIWIKLSHALNETEKIEIKTDGVELPKKPPSSGGIYRKVEQALAMR